MEISEVSPSVKNLSMPRGKLSFAIMDDDGVTHGEADLGNVSSLEITNVATFKEHDTAQEGIVVLDCKKAANQQYKIKFTPEEKSEKNMALFFLADSYAEKLSPASPTAQPSIWWAGDNSVIDSKGVVDLVWRDTPAYVDMGDGAFGFRASRVGQNYALSSASNALFPPASGAFAVSFKIKISSIIGEIYCIIRGNWANPAFSDWNINIDTGRVVSMSKLTPFGGYHSDLELGTLPVDALEHSILVSNSNGLVKTWIDGELVSTLGPDINYTWLASSNPVYLLATFVDGNFDAVISDIKFFNSAITYEESIAPKNSVSQVNKVYLDRWIDLGYWRITPDSLTIFGTNVNTFTKDDYAVDYENGLIMFFTGNAQGILDNTEYAFAFTYEDYSVPEFVPRTAPVIGFLRYRGLSEVGPRHTIKCWKVQIWPTAPLQLLKAQDYESLTFEGSIYDDDDSGSHPANPGFELLEVSEASSYPDPDPEPPVGDLPTAWYKGEDNFVDTMGGPDIVMLSSAYTPQFAVGNTGNCFRVALGPGGSGDNDLRIGLPTASDPASNITSATTFKLEYYFKGPLYQVFSGDTDVFNNKFKVELRYRGGLDSYVTLQDGTNTHYFTSGPDVDTTIWNRIELTYVTATGVWTVTINDTALIKTGPVNNIGATPAAFVPLPVRDYRMVINDRNFLIEEMFIDEIKIWNI